jgi:aerobic-type carbon monoxide dehydrogenase small subunit (CoxS/CutS family)
MSDDLRLGDAGSRGRRISLSIDGKPVTAFEGESVAGVLLAIGHIASRTSPVRGEARGYYCGMGQCWDCALVIDGRPNIRACMTPVADGMRIQTQAGFGPARLA